MASGMFNSAVNTLTLPILFRKTKLKQYCKILGLKGTHAEGHTFESIAGPIAELRKKYPRGGAIVLCAALQSEYGIRVSK
jgi:hypothetical protein